MSLEQIHSILAIGSVFTSLCSIAAALIGLKIKLATTQLQAAIDTHIATDSVKHAEIDRHLEFTDERVTRLEDSRRTQGRQRA